MLADGIEDDIVCLAVRGEVFLRVVDHPVGTERTREAEILCVAHGGDISSEVLRQLHSRGADRSGRAVDKDPLPLPGMCGSQARQCIEGSIANCRGFLKGYSNWLVSDLGTLLHAGELRVCPEPESRSAEDVVTDRELSDGCANGFDLS